MNRVEEAIVAVILAIGIVSVPILLVTIVSPKPAEKEITAPTCVNE